MNPLVQLRDYGQSPWYDYIRRGLITSGELKTLLDQDGLMGVTSNPSIFEKAIAGSTDYNQALKQMASDVRGVKDIYESLAIRDIQDAADLMHPLYEQTAARDGYVSLEVSPHLAFNTDATIEEALRLHKAIGRDNILIKVPATAEGIPAIELLLGQGININVTLLFGVGMYERVAEAYIAGVEKLKERGGNIKKLASVASFFISRIDTLVDAQLEAKAKETTDPLRKATLESLIGKIAIANAKIAYASYQRIFSSDRFAPLKAAGAQAQRLLWASTGTKNPKYPDTYYVEELIGQDTVNTMPAATFKAFRDHGKMRPSLTENLDEARETIASLAESGVDLSKATEKLLKEGARIFVESFDQLMSVISRKREELLSAKLDRRSYALGAFQQEVQAKLKELREQDFVRRLWDTDPTLWHKDPAHHKIIRNAMGWLHVIEQQVHHISRLKALSESVRAAGFQHVLLLGMGGSSLCPEVFRMTFGKVPGYPELHVLDSTVPAQLTRFERSVDLGKTLCIVSSKSGSTIEPLVFYQYFFDRMRQIKGDRAGDQFIAITDPGSLLEKLAKESKFREILPGVPEIGGRYSALSNFGIVPAALMGVNVEHLLYRAERMRHSCDSCVPAEDNPGVVLGTVLGELGKRGRDKITFIMSPAISALGAWLEQLLAESTGKEGKGLIPIDGETVGSPETYGEDRLFVYIRYTGSPLSAGEGIGKKEAVLAASGREGGTEGAMVAALEKAGHPIVRIDVLDLINLGEEFFLWEMATAVAGALLGIDAFDQPNVQESKDFTKALLDEFKRTGRLPQEEPLSVSNDIRLYADSANRQALGKVLSLEHVVTAHMNRIKPGDYVALNAYIDRNPANDLLLQGMRMKIRDKKKVATTIGYGPRFLHSTGQLHKGGPNSGVFLQITADDTEDVKIPGEPFTFGVLKAAQALGDFQSLSKRNRRALRIHLGSNVEEGLRRLQQAIDQAV